MEINIAETSLFTDLLRLKVSVSELCKSETESDTLSTGAVLFEMSEGTDTLPSDRDTSDFFL